MIVDPAEHVRRLTALVERGETTLLKTLAEELGMLAGSLVEYKATQIAAHGTLAEALAYATTNLQDEDARAAAAAQFRSSAKTLEHARIAFNQERGESLKWGSFKRLLERAAERGLDGSTPTKVPLGQVVKGLSTMAVFNPQTGDWEESVKWTKTKSEAPNAADAIQAATDALRRVPRLSPIPMPKKPMRSALLNSVVVTDLHIGQESDPRESGAVWNLAEAERVATGCADYLLRLAPPAKTLILSFLGDYLDFEGPTPQTFTSRHPMPNSSSFPSMVEAGARIARRLIDRGLETHEEVVVAIVDGNHDPVSAIWLRLLIATAYEREPRVTVLRGDPIDAPHCAYQFGKVMLAYAHQHLIKSSELPQLFRDTYRQMFGATTLAEVHCGHLHSYKVETHGKVKVFQHPTLAAKSRHTSRNFADNADRSMRLTTYHEAGWRLFEGMVTPEMLQLAE